MWLVKRAQRRDLLGRILDQAGPAQHHHRAVVDRVVEGRAGQHQAVDEGDGDAHVEAGGERAHHPAGGRAVEVQRVADPGIAGGHGEGLAVDDEGDVTDEAVVEDAVDLGAIEDAAFREAAQPGAIGDREGRGSGRVHDRRLPPGRMAKRATFCIFDQSTRVHARHPRPPPPSDTAPPDLRRAPAGHPRGAARAGDRVPSTRELAVALRVSRATVTVAYDQLIAEGYLETRTAPARSSAASFPTAEAARRHRGRRGRGHRRSGCRRWWRGWRRRSSGGRRPPG